MNGRSGSFVIAAVAAWALSGGGVAHAWGDVLDEVIAATELRMGQPRRGEELLQVALEQPHRERIADALATSGLEEAQRLAPRIRDRDVLLRVLPRDEMRGIYMSAPNATRARFDDAAAFSLQSVAYVDVAMPTRLQAVYALHEALHADLGVGEFYAWVRTMEYADEVGVAPDELGRIAAAAAGLQDAGLSRGAAVARALADSSYTSQRIWKTDMDLALGARYGVGPDDGDAWIRTLIDDALGGRASPLVQDMRGFARPSGSRAIASMRAVGDSIGRVPGSRFATLTGGGFLIEWAVGRGVHRLTGNEAVAHMTAMTAGIAGGAALEASLFGTTWAEAFGAAQTARAGVQGARAAQLSSAFRLGGRTSFAGLGTVVMMGVELNMMAYEVNRGIAAQVADPDFRGFTPEEADAYLLNGFSGYLRSVRRCYLGW